MNLVEGLRKARSLVAQGWHPWCCVDAQRRMCTREAEECVAWSITEALKVAFTALDRETTHWAALDILEALKPREFSLSELGDFNERTQAEALQLLDKAILRAIALQRRSA